jgi:hypothetical protein
MQTSGRVTVPHTQTKIAEPRMHDTSHAAPTPNRGRVAYLPNVSLSTPRSLTTQPLSVETYREDALDESDESSICHSPGWHGSSAKKRTNRKQGADNKRKDKAENLDMKAKLGKPQKRLTKPPPVTREIREIQTADPRVDSVNAMQKLDAITITHKPGAYGERPARCIPSVAVVAAPGKDSTNEAIGNFIGGVKLEQSVRSSAQAIKSTHHVSVTEHSSTKFSERRVANEPHQTPSHGKLREFSKASSSQSNEPENNSSSLPSRALNGGSKQANGHYVSKFEENIPKGHTGEDIQAPSTAIKSISAGNHGHAEARRGRREGQLASYSDRPPASYREPPQLAERESRRRRSGSFSFLQSLSRSRADDSADASPDEISTSKASSMTSGHSRRRSWSFRRGSKASSRPTTASSLQSSTSKDHSSEELSTAVSRENPPGHLRPDSGLSKGSTVERDNSRQNPLRGLKSAAKAAFTRKPPHITPMLSKLNMDDATISGIALPPHVDLPPFHLSSRFPRYPLQSPSQVEMLSYEEEHQIFTHSPPDGSSTHISRDVILPSSNTICSSMGVHEQNPSERLERGALFDDTSASSSSKGSSEEYHSMSDEATIRPTEATNVFLQPETSLIKGDEGNRSAANTAAQDEGVSMNKKHSASNEPVQSPERGQDRFQAKRQSRRNQHTSQIPSNSSKSSSSTGPLDTSFLPTLPHQPLARPDKAKGKERPSSPAPLQSARTFPKIIDIPPLTTPPQSSSTSSISSKLSNVHSAQYLHKARQSLPTPASTSRLSLVSTANSDPNTLAKMFVMCCNCHYYHDMPSKIYECMAKPDSLVADPGLGVSGVISTAVKCPWCGHGMSTGCCEGWAAVVVLKERLH